MPLQKIPQGRPATDPQMTKRRQLQERRRTLQTISELSATEHTPGFRTSIGHAQISPDRLGSTTAGTRKSSNVSKRQSLPQYCARPECIESRSPVPSTDMMLAQRAPLDREGHTSRTQPEVGWNARRAQARMQAEQTLSANTVRREMSSTSLQAGSFHSRANTPQLSRNKTSQPYLKSYYSQQHLIHDSRSMTSTPSRSDLTSSAGRPLRPSDSREHDGDSSEHTSTDSSSFRSSRDSTMRRSRSSSSSQSLTVPGVPPLPTGCPQPTRSYYMAATSHYRNGYPVQHPGPMYAKTPSEMRTSSLPYTRVDQYTTPLLGTMSPGPPKNMSSSYFNVPQKPRPKSVSARSSSSQQQQVRQKRSASVTQPARYKHPPSAPLPARPASISSRHRASSLKSPSSTKRTETVTFDQPPSVPDRQSLTKWKSEREEAKAEFNFMHRATMKERVRRANEMEQEKEKELQKMGMGAEKGARVLGGGLKERGCFGGLWGRIWGRGKR
ncbi:hypothetical protein HBH95_175830 [Parastagonospora nodorum]|nr:hypothetical protein HBH95_175830 [Parastagonospora nodorum]